MTVLFFKGLLIGFMIAAPVGPIALLCMRRTLEDGFKLGFATGMGAAVADAFYGAAAAFGVAAVGEFLTKHAQEFSLGGSLVMFVLGWRMLALNKREKNAPDSHPHSYPAAFFSSLILTITNPVTVLAFAAMLTMLGVGSGLTQFDAAALLLLGIFLGSTFWWLSLCLIVRQIKHIVTERILNKINTFAGIALILFGFYALAKGLLIL